MTTRIRHIWMLMLLLMMVACSADDNFREEDVNNPVSYYLTLKVQLSSDGTRTGDDHSEHPEDSDKDNTEGLVIAKDYEETIKDICFFVVDLNDDQAKGKTLLEASQLDLPFVAAMYVPTAGGILPDGTTYNSTSKVIKIKIDNGKTIRNNYALVAVANMGDITTGNREIQNIFTEQNNSQPVPVAPAGNTINSLHKLRKHIAGKIWDDMSGKVVDKTNFAMSSISINGQDNESGGVLFRIKGEGSELKGTEDNPFKAECWLMRLAARIDIGCNENDQDCKYGRIAETTAENGTKYREIVYKAFDETEESPARQSLPAIGTIYLTGVELFNAKNTPSYTLRHTVDGNVIGNIAKLDITDQKFICGGKMTRSNKLENSYVVVPDFILKTASENHASLYDNTHASLWTNIESPTGTAFSENRTKLINYTAHITDHQDQSVGFNRVLTVGYVNENTYNNALDPADKELANTNYATGLALKTVFVPAVVYDTAEDALAADNGGTEVAGKPGKRDDTFHMWRGTVEGKQKSVFFSSFSAAKAYRDKLNAGEVKSYKDGVGYHELFIEHADAGAAAQSVMKHGIVRNNVYRVLLKFRGPGKTYYEEKIQDVDWHVYTRDWNLREWNVREEPATTL